MGSWEGEVWRWNFSWRRDPFTWEIPIQDDFLVLIHQFVPSVYEDKWVWRMNVEGGFSVHDYYELLFRSFRETHVVDRCEEVAFERVWKCGAPSKVCAFTWQVLLGRIQTTENLWKRRVLQQHQTNCVFCGVSLETTIHLFLHCPFSSKVWYGLMRWLGFVIIPPPNWVSSFGSLVDHGRGKMGKKGLAIIWCSFLWSIWKIRNDCVFNNIVADVVETLDHAKFQAWKWFMGRVAKSPYLLYEWNWSPLDCLR
ncbi:hypothetical protein P8452_43119 [Trifolium repens]|nr:hypothetical protein QL285_027947 [Trifolium repens]WJX57574.1 hypothetical protein P8452_43119 [Trifolium repens]